MHNVRLTWTLDEQTLLEGRSGSFDAHSTSGPSAPNGRFGPAPHRDAFTGVFSMNATSLSDNDRETRNAAVTVTRYVRRLAGASHEVKAGVDYEHARSLIMSGWPGGALYQDYDGAPNLVNFWDGATYRSIHHRTSVFVQDTWAMGGQVTIEPGIRIGIYRGAVPIPSATPYNNSSVSPRLGAAWDVSSDHRTVVRAHYGRYHDAMVTSFYDFVDPLAQTPFITARVISPGQFEELSRSGSGDPSRITIDPDAKHSYAEEYVAGLERELGARLSLRAQYVRRNFKDSLGFIDTRSTWTPVGAIDPGPDGLAGVGGDDAVITLYNNLHPENAFLVLTNPAGAWRRYDGFQLIGTRRYTRGWELQASYTWARSRGNFDNEFSSNAANNDLSLNGNFVNPNRALLSGTRTVFDRRHDVKVLGTYLVPYWGGLRVSGIYRFVSGQPWARLLEINRISPSTNICCTVMEPVGARQLPASSNDTDLRVEKTLTLRSKGKVGVFLDLFNISNRGVALRVETRGGPNFLLPTAWAQPRVLRAGMRMSF